MPSLRHGSGALCTGSQNPNSILWRLAALGRAAFAFLCEVACAHVVSCVHQCPPVTFPSCRARRSLQRKIVERVSTHAAPAHKSHRSHRAVRGAGGGAHAVPSYFLSISPLFPAVISRWFRSGLRRYIKRHATHTHTMPARAPPPGPPPRQPSLTSHGGERQRERGASPPDGLERCMRHTQNASRHGHTNKRALR
eukprot:2215946-Prymnesium_polylepis.1